MPCVQIAGHRPALEECARWRSPTVPAAVKSPSSALVPAARLPGSASWAFSGDLLHGAEPPPSSRCESLNPHSASRTLGAPPSAISSLSQLPTPAVGACGSVAVAGVRNPAQEETWERLQTSRPRASSGRPWRGCYSLWYGEQMQLIFIYGQVASGKLT